MDQSVVYGEQRISVSEEVAEFPEDDRRRQADRDKRDEHHLSKSDFENGALAAKADLSAWLEGRSIPKPSLAKSEKSDCLSVRRRENTDSVVFL